MPLPVEAYGKLNLTLEVLGQRPDGYHEVASVLQTISLADRLVFRPATQLSLECSEPSLENEDNLVLRAARLLQEETGTTKGAAIVLEKGIPTASGLGGGSSDAAATLWALAQLWKLKLGETQLCSLATRIGSDVPFFLIGGTALARGRGEQITPLPPVAESWFLVIRPKLDIPQKTATLYGLLPKHHWTRGHATQRLADALTAGEPLRETSLYNVFDAVSPDAFPMISQWRRRLLEVAPSRPHLAGAGPSLYIPVETERQGQQVLRRLPQRSEADFFVVRTVRYAHTVSPGQESP